MRDKDEAELHRRMKGIEGTYEAKAPWGRIAVTLNAIPHYAGGKGCPDEILVVNVEFGILGTPIKLTAPVLIELEKPGYRDALIDLNKFCERSISGKQRSYLHIPMVVVGGASKKKPKGQDRHVAAHFDLSQVPHRVIE